MGSLVKLASPVGRRSARDERRVRAALADRDPEAVALLQATYGSTVLGYLRYVLRDEHTADDVFQRVMIQAWRDGAAFNAARGSLLTWLMTIARSRALDELRRRVPEPVDPASVATLHEAHASDEDPGEQIAAQWRLRHLLGQLPAAEARLLRMRFELGLSQSEIALATGIALGTVKMRMSRALQRLRDLIEGYE